MGRRRKDTRLPPYVAQWKGRYYYRPYRDGKLQRRVWLCDAKAPLSEIHAAYERATTEGRGDTLTWLADLYLASEDFAEKKPSTQHNYRQCHTQLMKAPVRSEGRFGDMSFRRITTGVIQKYVDWRAKSARVRANRELAYLSIVFAWAKRRDMVQQNPCIGVKRKTETARKRYVEDGEYQFVYELAHDFPPYIRPMMELAYLCRLRSAEVLMLRESDVLDEGLDVHRLKGSKDQIILWSPRLRAAIDAARATRGRVLGLDSYLLGGYEPLKICTFQTAWQRLMGKAMKQGLKERFTFHDLKAKGVSDFQGEKRDAAGHKTVAMAEVYDRKKGRVPPTA